MERGIIAEYLKTVDKYLKEKKILFTHRDTMLLMREVIKKIVSEDRIEEEHIETVFKQVLTAANQDLCFRRP